MIESLSSRRLRRQALVQGTVATLALGALAGCDRGTKQAEAPVARPVLSIVAHAAAARATAFAGTVQPKVSAGLGFPIFGRLLARDVNIGDPVHKGDVLASIDPLALSLALRSSQASLSSAQAELRNAKASEARLRSLRETGTGTQADLDTATAATAAAQSAVLRAESDRTKAEEQLNDTRLVAAFDGVVTAVAAEIGQVVPAGQAVVTIAQPDLRDAVVDAPEATAAGLTSASRFSIALQFDPTTTVSGSVREIAPLADSLTRTRRIKIALDNPPASFRLGTTITATLQASPDDMIELPASAILSRDGKSYVWIIDPAKKVVLLQEVATVPRRDGLTGVARGVAEGDRVVTAGVHSLTDGQTVKIAGDE